MMESSNSPKQIINVSSLAHTKMVLHAVRHPNSTIHGILLGSIGADSTSNSGSATLEITNALPVFHSTPTKPLLEISLRLAESYCSSSNSSSTTTTPTTTSISKQKIVGWYTANERINDTTPNQAALKIMSSIASQWSLDKELDFRKDLNGLEPVLGFLTPSGLTSLLSSSSGGESKGDDACAGELDWFGSDYKHHWLEPYPTSNITSSSSSNMELIQQAVSASLNEHSEVELYDFEDHLEGNDAKEKDWIRNDSVTRFVQESNK